MTATMDFDYVGMVPDPIEQTIRAIVRLSVLLDKQQY
jgi:hypothetical protein